MLLLLFLRSYGSESDEFAEDDNDFQNKANEICLVFKGCSLISGGKDRANIQLQQTGDR